MHLLIAQVFYIYKVMQIIVICKNERFMLIIFEIVLQYLKNFNNGQNLIVIALVVDFGKDYSLREENYQIL